MIIDDNKLKMIFSPNKKCIVNTDLDGILSGMLLQKALNWEVVGYSSCAGKIDDELWLKDINSDLEEIVFIDLPVVNKNITVIDQHFVALDDEYIDEYNRSGNKINPNIIRSKVFVTPNLGCQYTEKYPFGTVHFIYACLERLNLMNFAIDFNKKIDKFELLDLFLRADCVIGNTNKYTKNCFNWIDWLCKIGGHTTQQIFSQIKNEYRNRLSNESCVENRLISLGCNRPDGDCSNMFRAKDYNAISRYFNFLSEAFEIEPIPVLDIFDFNKLIGRRIFINQNMREIDEILRDEELFSFAFVSKKFLSITSMQTKEGENE